MAVAGSAAGSGSAVSQTLSRGIQALEALAAAPARGMAVDEVAEALGLHRSIVYRLLRTLEQHRLAERDGTGRYHPGVGLAVLSRAVLPDLRAAAQRVLEDLVADLDMTAFVVVARNHDCVTLVSVEPRRAGANLAQRPGTIHPLERGAPGLALLAAGVPDGGARRAQVQLVRDRGWAASRDEVVAGLRSVAVPVPAHLGEPCALAVVHLVGEEVDEVALVDRLSAAAGDLARSLGA